MSLSMTLMICAIIFFVIVTPLIVVDYVKDSRKLKDTQEELEHHKRENIILSRAVESREDDIKDIKEELEKANKTIKRLTDMDATTNKVTIVRSTRPITVVSGCIEIPNEVLYDKLDDYETQRIEDAFMHQMYRAFKQSILPSAEFMLEDDPCRLNKQLMYRIPVTIPDRAMIDVTSKYPFTDLISKLDEEAQWRGI